MRLRDTLLRWLLWPSLALWTAGFAIAHLRSLEQAHDAYDRTLLGAALVIAEGLQMADGAVVAKLPYAALEMLRTDAQDRIFYRIVDLEDGRQITGYEDLRSPGTPPRADQPLFYDLDYRGEATRVAAIAHALIDGARQRPVLVLVAETIDARRALSRRITTDVALVMLALIAAAAALTTFGVRRGLLPLRRLREVVRSRGPSDLTPIDEAGVPREVSPLIEAINIHTERQRAMAEMQRRFIASASHQLKTPLTVLRAQAAHALRQSELPAMRDALNQLHDTTHGTARLVQQLLTLARSEPGHTLEIESLDLAEASREVTFGLLPLARAKPIDLGFDDGGGARLPVRGEALLLRELISNLVHNAICYTPPQGSVTVAVGLRDGRAELCVEDDGPGIAPALRERVFEPFYRQPGGGVEGNGLGLAIVKEISARHGLAVTLEDGDGGRGLRVRVLWPLEPCTGSSLSQPRRSAR